MTKSIELTDAELALMLEALVKRGNRRSASTTVDPDSTATDDHRRKAQTYAALAIKLRSER